jgi:perosamine synthetase
MVCSKDDELADLSGRIKGQGLAKNQEYFHDIIGYNYRMTNICAAIGCAQLERINNILLNKRRVAQQYIENLIGLPIDYHKEFGNVKHSYWMFTILVNSESQRTELRIHLKENGIETRPTFIVHTCHVFTNENFGCRRSWKENKSSKLS